MATIEEGIYTFLKADSGVSALVGTRVYAMRFPASVTLPAIAYQRISGVRDHYLNGTSDIAEPRFQFTCWGSTYESAKAVANSVRAAMDGYSGTMGSVTVYIAEIQNEVDHQDREYATDIYQVSLDFRIVHKE